MNRIMSQVKRLTPLSKLVSSRCPTIEFGKLPKIGSCARVDDDAGTESANHAAAHEAKTRQAERIGDVSVAGMRRLLGRHRLAGKCRLIDKEILGADEAEIGGNHIAGRNAHDIARHELFDRNFDEAIGVAVSRSAAASLDAGRRFHHGAELGGGVIGAMLLDESRNDGEKDNDRNDRGCSDVTKEIRSRGKTEEQCVQGVFCPPP